jgi:hypothetical protein
MAIFGLSAAGRQILTASGELCSFGRLASTHSRPLAGLARGKSF